ncbi:radical SAM protein [Thermodesulfobacterium sp. TA1]|uniref:radical SAM protein n=1 Tax=Thermodesulfobacterium sp. TA1 TaxID=2234087 RepID=UPI001231FF95|nr:radical SAM protein [Thermodesulfobacterium sp. TA1]QER41708.1 radical SAM protein [Thermodesulfobacterium sp. TA1]
MEEKEPREKKRLLFGPVRSRRLDRSLGIDLVPRKVCSMDCLYCEVGKTTFLTTERKFYFTKEEIEEAVFSAKEKQDLFDVFTITGSGEPTLNLYFEETLFLAKKHLSKPVAVLTNSTFLHLSSVREALCEADLVLPSLDSAREETFFLINRPAKEVSLERIIEGLRCLRREMKGEMWLEVFFLAGINDTREDLEALKKAIEEIDPHRVQLNTAVRPVAYQGVKPVSYKRLQEIATFLGEKSEVIVSKERLERRLLALSLENLEKEIVAYVKRRPAQLEELSQAFGVEPKVLLKAIEHLCEKGLLHLKTLEGQIYYTA